MVGGPSGAAAGRRTLRERKVSQRMAVVDDAARQEAAQARLDALENDHDAPDAFAAADSDDDEFNLHDDEDDDEPGAGGKGARRRNKGGAAPSGMKRKLRGGGSSERRGAKSFARLLEDAELERVPPGTATYATAAAAPARTSAPRKFCAVCGNASPYTCSRCGSRYCCRRCFGIHTETRCLKFMA